MSLPSTFLGMGTWRMGGTYERDETTVEQSVAVLKLGLSLGLTRIDTAELYGAGLTEEIVGMAVADIPRDQAHITSKVWRTHMRYDDVLQAAEKSLDRMNISYLDLYLVHWPNSEVPLQETMRAMERLVDTGIVKEIGVSNFSVEEIKEAQSHLSHTLLSALQIEYNVLNQTAHRDTIPYCKEHSIEVTAYRPLAKGMIAHAESKTLKSLAQKYNKTENQIAINWVLAQGIVAIPATLHSDHLRENVDALNFTMDKDDIHLLIG